MSSAQDLLNDPFFNKGTAFTNEERHKWNLSGMLPSDVQTQDQQEQRCYEQFKNLKDKLNQRKFLMTIYNTNRRLFYYLFGRHLEEMLPIVYDPVIAEAIENYNEIFLKPQGAAFLSIDHPEHMAEALRNASEGRDIKLIVVSDAGAILGIGDWGVNGVDIAIGKLMVYTAAAGINPENVLPVSLDVGTDNQKLLNDTLYLGNRHARVEGKKYDAFVDQFVQTVQYMFPNVMLHFEDFGRENAARILDRYRDRYLVFNDDIQGTGIISLAAVLGALDISKESITEQRFLTYGAGTAGMGIAKTLYDELIRQGLSPKEAKSHFYLVDKQGLLFEDTPGLTPEQKEFVRNSKEFDNREKLTNLYEIIKAVKPTVMIGTSKQPGAFTEKVVKEMAKYAARPIIFPLSNPTKLAEATAADLINWTEGKALVATGVPTPPVEYNGVTYTIGQGNNALIYPGLGLGAIAVDARIINDNMLSAAAHSLVGLVDPDKPGAAVLPPVNNLIAFSQRVAEHVAQSAIDQGLAKYVNNAQEAVQKLVWSPKY